MRALPPDSKGGATNTDCFLDVSNPAEAGVEAEGEELEEEVEVVVGVGSAERIEGELLTKEELLTTVAEGAAVLSTETDAGRAGEDSVAAAGGEDWVGLTQVTSSVLMFHQ